VNVWSQLFKTGAVKRAADRMYRIGESAEKLELCGRQDGERGL